MGAQRWGAAQAQVGATVRRLVWASAHGLHPSSEVLGRKNWPLSARRSGPSSPVGTPASACLLSCPGFSRGCFTPNRPCPLSSLRPHPRDRIPVAVSVALPVTWALSLCGAPLPVPLRLLAGLRAAVLWASVSPECWSCWPRVSLAGSRLPLLHFCLMVLGPQVRPLVPASPLPSILLLSRTVPTGSPDSAWELRPGVPWLHFSRQLCRSSTHMDPESLSPGPHSVTPSEHGVPQPWPSILPAGGGEGPGSRMWHRIPWVSCPLNHLALEIPYYLVCSAHGPTALSSGSC